MLAGPMGERHVVGMTGKGKAAEREREERLAAALRENLRRRKAQARSLAESAGETEPDRD